jgi:hypothetical protein
MPQKLYVRFSTPADEKNIFDFYKQNQHTFVFLRDPEVWKERIAAGAVTLIEDEKGTIVASSISYPALNKDAAGNEIHQWTEVGSTRVAMGGIGLFDPMVTAQLLRAYLLEPPKDRFVMEIILGNEHSKHVFTKLGATLYNAPPEMLKAVKSTIAPGSGEDPVEWFQIGAEAMPGVAATFLEAQKNNVRTNKATGETYELDFSRCVLVTRFDAEVKQLAKQNLGNAATPDLKKPLKAPPSTSNKFTPPNPKPGQNRG